MSAKKFEIFSGTGGVGKTTLATARALSLSAQEKRVLLITIDPAKRLKDLLGLSDENSGETNHVSFDHDGEELKLDVILMNPEKTFLKIAQETKQHDILENRILKILTRPYGGLNEILSVVELQYQVNQNLYDCIILDTPPGSHFLDFLDSIERIRVFFDQSFIDIFTYLGKKVETNTRMNFGKRMVTMVVSGGVKKLLGYLSKVTGEKFVEDFIEAVLHIYSTKDAFLGALKLQKTLRDPEHCDWYLVTSVEQNKLDEALELKKNASDLFSEESFIAVNKCLSESLSNWTPAEGTKEEELKKFLVKREEQLKSGLQKHFKNILSFPEILSIDTHVHLIKLIQTWQKVRT